MLFAGIVLIFVLVYLLTRKLPLAIKIYKHSHLYTLLLLEFFIYWVILIQLFPPDFHSTALPAALLALATSYNLPMGRRRTLCMLIFAAGMIVAGWLKSYESQFGAPGFDTYMAIFQTNPAEAGQYVFAYFDPSTLVMIVFFVLWFIYGYRYLLRHSYLSPVSATSRKRLSIFFVMTAVVGFAEFSEAAKLRYTIFNGSLKKYISTIEEQKRVSEQIQKQFHSNELPDIAFAFDGNLVFVIGESTTRRHMSLYGYYRDTTPRLNLIKDRLLIHKDTVATHSYTIFSVPRILNFNYDVTAGDQEQGYDLMTTLKAGGFRTWWLSNQNEVGAWDNLVSLIGKTADAYYFNRKTFGESFRGDYYDHQLLEPLRNALAEPGKKAIFIHLYAAHNDYCKGIPENFRGSPDWGSALDKKYFGNFDAKAEQLNCYDNAIHYVDSVLGDIVDIMDTSATPTIMTFIADHGEHPTDGSSHNRSRHSAYHVEIPNIFLFNPEAAEMYADKAINFKANAEKPFLASDTYHTLIDLLQPDRIVHQAGSSLFSPDYVPSKRELFCAQGECMDYDDPWSSRGHDYLEVSRANLSRLEQADREAYRKIWAHRVNTLGKLMEAKEIFAGVEADVVYDTEDAEFYVFHPPKENIHLSLDTYLAALGEHSEVRLWLDWKNATPGNFDSALKRLNQLHSLYNLKNRAIIETGPGSVFPDLKGLSDSGYRHSYYAPTAQVKSCIEQIDDAECLALANKITDHAGEIGAKAISYDYQLDPFFKKQTFQGHDLLTWNLDVNVASKNTAWQKEEYAKFDAILVAFPSLYDY